MDKLQMEKMMKLIGEYVTVLIHPTNKVDVVIWGRLCYNGNDSWSVKIQGLTSVVFSSDSVATIWEDDAKISLKV